MPVALTMHNIDIAISAASGHESLPFGGYNPWRYTVNIFHNYIIYIIFLPTSYIELYSGGSAPLRMLRSNLSRNSSSLMNSSFVFTATQR